MLGHVHVHAHVHAHVHVHVHMQGSVQGMHLGGTLQSLPRSCSVIELSLPILDLQYSSSVSGPTSSAEAARLWSFSASRSSTL